MKRYLAGIFLLTLQAGTAHAALISRLSGAAYYDDVLNITWLADANLADTNTFGVTGVFGGGGMTWATAGEWIGAMNTASYLGTSDWRLPTVTDTSTSGCDFAYTGTDCGYNVDLSTGEMAHLFYSTLGNTGRFDTSGTETGCSVSSPVCLTNTGPFTNLQPYFYWSGTTYAPNPSDAWDFSFATGLQYASATTTLYAWAVRPGDIAAVPVPGVGWLFGSALGGVMGARRRRAQSRLRVRLPHPNGECGP